MGALTTALALLAAAAQPDTVARWQPLIAEASAQCGVPEAWIVAVMRAESGGRTALGGRPTRSPKGAIGLMQLMPGTWSDLRAALGLGADPDDPRDNIVAGACYLRQMYDRFGHPGLFAAYNAGPARYAAYLAGRSRLPREATAYLETVAGTASRPPAGQSPPLFAVRREAVELLPARGGTGPEAGLFAIRRPVE